MVTAERPGHEGPALWCVCQDLAGALRSSSPLRGEKAAAGATAEAPFEMRGRLTGSDGAGVTRLAARPSGRLGLPPPKKMAISPSGVPGIEAPDVLHGVRHLIETGAAACLVRPDPMVTFTGQKTA
jgi:hypothetical protein